MLCEVRWRNILRPMSYDNRTLWKSPEDGTRCQNMKTLFVCLSEKRQRVFKTQFGSVLNTSNIFLQACEKVLLLFT